MLSFLKATNTYKVLIFLNGRLVSVLYYECYFPRLVTERGLGVARIISFFNGIYHSKCN